MISVSCLFVCLFYSRDHKVQMACLVQGDLPESQERRDCLEQLDPMDHLYVIMKHYITVKVYHILLQQYYNHMVVYNKCTHML